MATASSSDTLSVADWDHGSASKSDRYLAARLAAAGADFKGVAVATFVLAAAVATLAWLAAGVVAEHWIVPGGLPAAVRWIWLVVGLTALAAAVVRWVVPLMRYRVNLVYAARVIEHEHPELHNDLVNAVLVKAHPEAASAHVVRALERRAARRLSVVPADGIADRGFTLRLAVALAALVAALCVYQLVAPKSLLVTAGRLVAPWWGLAAPARVSIAPLRLSWCMPPDGAGGDRPVRSLEVVGGTVTLGRGRQLLVETDIEGLRTGDRPELVVMPLRDDGTLDAVAPWRVALVGGAEPGRVTAVLPDATRGLQQSVEFLVVAGDARADKVRVAVVDTPTLLVREVRYDYPPYTGRKPETVAWQGDLRAPEFTKVTITAEGNRPLEAAWIDPGCGGRESEKKPMRVGQHDLSRASGEFPLRMNVDRTGPEFASYRLIFQPRSASGVKEPPVVEKLEHRIEVIADLAPEVSIDAPADAIRVPPSAPVTIHVRALDPDYGLARVGIETRVNGGAERPPAWILERPHAGVLTTATELVPERVGAAAGSLLEYRAVALDARPERPNIAHSPWRSLQIDAGAPPPTDRPVPRGGNDDAGAAPRADGGRGPDEGQPRDDGARRESGEKPGQDVQQGGRGPNAGGKGGGAEGQSQPGQAPGGAGGQSQAERKGKSAGRNAGENSGADGDRHDGRQDGARGERGGDAPRGDAARRDGGPADSRQQRGDGTRDDHEHAGDRPEGRGDGRRAPPQNAVASDGTNDGEAMDRILDNRRRQEADQTVRKSGSGKTPEPRPGASGAPRDGSKADQPDGPSRQAEKPPRDGERKDGDTPQQPCPGADGKPCGKEGCSSCSGGEKSGGGSGAGAGQGQSGTGQSGQGQSGQGQSGQGQSGQGQSGQGQSGQGQSGEGQSGEGQSGEGQSGEGQSGEGQSGRDQPGKGQTDQGQPGRGQTEESQNGQGLPYEGQRGQGQPGEDEQGQAQPGQGQQRQGQPGESEAVKGQPGQRQSGEDQSGKNESREGQSGEGQPGEGQRGQGERGGVADGRTGRPGDKSGAGDLPAGPQPAPGSEIGAGGRSGGDRGDPRQPADGSAPQRRDAEWTEQDTAHARNAADLAVEHLRDSVNAGRSDVLDELGWTPEQARAFIDRWEAMRRLAGSPDSRDRGEFERAVRSLGLRPDGVRATRDVPADARGGQAQGRRSRPPAAYREQVEAYLRGAGGE